ncbi:hypothetical protein QJS10_CPB04g01718 [Acorus calamus]|uniref:Uncharacterized protein n=1 Tax=Acorus calamus TaxID=4465 RepID=A0AAV9EZF7_ACOCL|nr:hypothetical protein QJS10_CPB04g01718 [Acorus calamus]
MEASPSCRANRSPTIEIFVTIEHNVSSYVLPIPDDREAQNRCLYDASDERDDDDPHDYEEAQDLQYALKPPKCIKPPERPRKKRIKSHDEESKSTKISEKAFGRPTKVDSREVGGAMRVRDVAGLNSHSGTPTEGRGTTRGYCDGDPIMGGLGRGYGRGMFSYGTDNLKAILNSFSKLTYTLICDYPI